MSIKMRSKLPAAAAVSIMPRIISFSSRSVIVKYFAPSETLKISKMALTLDLHNHRYLSFLIEYPVEEIYNQ
jgi:hypothetical protein